MVQGTSARRGFRAAFKAPAALLMTALAPDLVLSDNKVAQPTPAVLTLTGGTPAVLTPALSLPSPASLTLTGAVPTVLLLPPVTVTPSAVSGVMHLAFPTASGVTYEVLYANSLNSPITWHTNSTIAGDGTVKGVSDPIGATQRFYRVLEHY